jgi:hypothetical protein
VPVAQLSEVPSPQSTVYAPDTVNAQKQLSVVTIYNPTTFWSVLNTVGSVTQSLGRTHGVGALL